MPRSGPQKYANLLHEMAEPIKTIPDAIQHLTARVMSDDKYVKKVNANWNLSVRGENAGSWVVRCKVPVSVVPGHDQACCEINIESDALLKILNKELNPQCAFNKGLIKVKGDPICALTCSEIFL